MSNINLVESIRAIKMRESLYQSQLQNTKNALQKLYQNIDVTPHSRNSEYQRNVYGEEENE